MAEDNPAEKLKCGHSEQEHVELAKLTSEQQETTQHLAKCETIGETGESNADLKIVNDLIDVHAVDLLTHHDKTPLLEFGLEIAQKIRERIYLHNQRFRSLCWT